MKYSVVIPLYNKAAYIGRVLNSVLNQSYEDYEIIVVDDGSTDHSYEAASLIHSDKLKLIHQENQGVSVARNTAIAASKGEFIAFLDADDEWDDDYLETIDGLTKEYPESGFFVTAYRIDMGKGKCNVSTRLEPLTGCIDSYWMTYQYPYDFVWTSATVIRRETVLKAGGFRPGEKIGQDLDLWLRVARLHSKVAYSAKICVTYNRSAESNARTRVRIAKAGALLRNLEKELKNPEHKAEELSMIKHKYDLKMTVYVYTCILAGDKMTACKAMKGWQGKNSLSICLVKIGLRITMLMPKRVLRMVYAIRLKIF